MEGQSLNEPLRDQSWLLTISLQLIRQGNRSPQCFTPSRPPTAPIFLLYTNKPITATDINWTPFLKMLLQPFFFFALPYSAPISLPTRQTVYTHTRAHSHTCVCLCIHLAVLSVSQPSQSSCSFIQSGFICLYIPLIYYHVKYRLKITSVFF